MSAADVWQIMRETTEADAKRLKWPKSLLTETLQSHWYELKAVYPRAEMDALAAAEVKRNIEGKSKLWHLKQRAKRLLAALPRRKA